MGCFKMLLYIISTLRAHMQSTTKLIHLYYNHQLRVLYNKTVEANKLTLPPPPLHLVILQAASKHSNSNTYTHSNNNNSSRQNVHRVPSPSPPAKSLQRFLQAPLKILIIICLKKLTHSPKQDHRKDEGIIAGTTQDSLDRE